ncbi:hypothetical protein [Rufibacter soli]|jgi:hypothetical protein
MENDIIFSIIKDFLTQRAGVPGRWFVQKMKRQVDPGFPCGGAENLLQATEKKQQAYGSLRHGKGGNWGVTRNAGRKDSA